MGWLAFLKPLLDLFGSIFAKIFMEAQKTPGREEKVDVQEGDAPPVDDHYYDGRYGM